MEQCSDFSILGLDKQSLRELGFGTDSKGVTYREGTYSMEGEYLKVVGAANVLDLIESEFYTK